ncbi:hypothetical protein [Streptomyces hokutonensis]|uniref:hypothetical protein n=1 Tax=Streptomyces hokutonensis TaxID=1306990 RepID=UPI00340431D6
MPWNGLSRGAVHQLARPDEDAKKIGINPVAGGVRTEDEGLYPIQHARGRLVAARATSTRPARSSSRPSPTWNTCRSCTTATGPGSTSPTARPCTGPTSAGRPTSS